MAIALALSYFTMLLCVRLWQRNKFLLSIPLAVLGVFSYAFIVICGIIYSSSVLRGNTSGTISMFVMSFLLVPLYFFGLGGLAALLYHNDGNFITREVKNVKQLLKRKATTKVADRDLYRKEKRAVISPRMKDVARILLFLALIFIVFLHFIVTVPLYHPASVSCIIGSWGMILINIIILVVKYMRQFSGIWKDPWLYIGSGASLFFKICSLTAYIVQIVFEARKYRDGKTSFIYSYSITGALLHILLPIGLTYLFLFVKLQEMYRKFWIVKLTALSILILILIGLSIGAFLLDFIATGCELVSLIVFSLWKVVTSVKCVEKKLNEKKRFVIELILLIMWVTLIVIILLSVIGNKTKAVLEAISFAVYMTITFTLVNFAYQFLKNRRARKTQIFERSPNLIPQFRLETNGKDV